jgi:hypothetical protein
MYWYVNIDISIDSEGEGMVPERVLVFIVYIIDRYREKIKVIEPEESRDIENRRQ